jgi:hypothetical protein
MNIKPKQLQTPVGVNMFFMHIVPNPSKFYNFILSLNQQDILLDKYDISLKKKILYSSTRLLHKLGLDGVESLLLGRRKTSARNQKTQTGIDRSPRESSNANVSAQHQCKFVHYSSSSLQIFLLIYNETENRYGKFQQNFSRLIGSRARKRVVCGFLMDPL